MDTMFDIQEFEESARQNGSKYWLAHEFMQRLGYESWHSFKGVVNKAIALCVRIGADPMEAITPHSVTGEDGKAFSTYKLTRFGCLLVTMQADSKKPDVARAQAALAAVAAALVERYLNTNTLDRLEKREELKLAEQLLSGTAQGAGVQSAEFGIFKDAGFRGMYNMSLAELKAYKGAGSHKGTLYDLMGLTEMAANTFRVTQTSERLKRDRAGGLRQAARIAEDVGKEVRGVMTRSSGTRPEDLHLEEDLNLVKKGIRMAGKELAKIDSGKKKPKP